MAIGVGDDGLPIGMSPEEAIRLGLATRGGPNHDGDPGHEDSWGWEGK